MSSNAVWRAATLGVLALAGAVALRPLAQPAYAERMAAPSGAGVATLSLNTVLKALDERGVREKELEEFIKSLETKVEGIVKQARQAQEDIKLLAVDSAEWLAKRDEMIRYRLSAEGEAKLAQALAEERRKDLHLRLFEAIRDAAGRYATSEGIQIVVNSDADVQIPDSLSENQVQAAILGRKVLFAAPGIDISEAVARLMNNEFKAR